MVLIVGDLNSIAFRVKRKRGGVGNGGGRNGGDHNAVLMQNAPDRTNWVVVTVETETHGGGQLLYYWYWL
jgi:hypothetical protein